MNENSWRTHPLIVIAATTVILTCLLAIGIMTGILPSPMAKDRGDISVKVIERPEPATANRSNLAESVSGVPEKRSQFAERGTAATDNRTTARPSASVARERSVERPAVGATRSTPPEQPLAGNTAPAPRVAAVCQNCGTVTSVRTVSRQGDAGNVGPLAGTAIGGLVGSQIGSGSGKTAATIIGAAGGAAIGTEVERRQKATTSYIVNVRLNDGTTRSFTYGSAPGYREGERVRVVDGRLVRDS